MLNGKQIKDTSLNLAKINPVTGQTLTLQGTSKIQQNEAPTADIDLANKAYVDSVATGLDVKKSVRAATVTDLTIASASSSIDGIILVSGDRILVKNQLTASENGIYNFNGVGNPLTRSIDANTNSEVTAGLFTFIEEGLTYQETGWVLATDDPITLGSTYLTFSQFSSNGVVSASNGLTKIINDIKLGGILTQNTFITASNYDFEIIDSNRMRLLTISSSIIMDSNTDISSTNIQLDSVNNTLLTAGGGSRKINLYGSTQSILNNGINNTMIVGDDNLKGLVYEDDYSSNFTPESLVSKRYVDNQVSTGVSASNGLTKVGIDIELGGSLTKNTYINGAFDLNIGLSTSLSKFYSQVSDGISTSIIDEQSGGIELSTTEGSTNSNVRVFTTNTEISSSGLSGSSLINIYNDGQIITNNGSENMIIIQDDNGSKGAVYATDYSFNFTPESLVSKRYVDNKTTALTSSVSNGLTYSNGSIKLGGNLIENTNIDGAFDLRIGNSNTINVFDVQAGNTASVYTKIYTDGSQSALRTDDAINGEYNIILAESGAGVNLISSDITGTTVSAFFIFNQANAIPNNGSNNFFRIFDENGNKGLVYATDYSVNFTPESLVSKRYVDNTISSNNLTYSNGLIKTGNQVLLGGTLSQNTTINGSTFSLLLGSPSSKLSGMDVNASGQINIVSDTNTSITNNIGTSMYVQSNNIAGMDYDDGLFFQSIRISSTSSSISSSDSTEQKYSAIHINDIGYTSSDGSTNSYIIMTDQKGSKGAVYAADYSANFTPESLVSKRYVDTRIQVGVSASNGLYENGNYVQLGGTLSQNTNITGYGYTFSLDADTVLLTSTSSTNVMAMLEVDAVQSGWIRSDVTDGTNSSIHLMSLTQHVMLIDDTVNSSTITATTNSITLITDNGADQSSLSIYNTPQTIANNGVNNNLVILDEVSSKGLVYATDYSANFTPESLVSKRYVDTQVGGILSLDNKSMTASVTTASGQQISGAITTTPKNDSYVSVYINGLKMKLGNGVTTYDVYFADSGNLAVARTIANIQSGDVLVRGTGLGYDTDATDLVDYDFQF